MRTFNDLKVGDYILRVMTTSSRIISTYPDIKNIEDREEGRRFYLPYDNVTIPYDELKDCSFKNYSTLYFSEAKTGLRYCCNHVNNVKKSYESTKKDFEAMVLEAVGRGRDKGLNESEISEEYVKDFLTCD